jgi:microcompartment protein CcmL/EutN
MGKSVIPKPRGDTAKIIPKRQNKSDTDEETPAKLQKTYMEDPDNAEEAIKSIICENLKTINAPKLKGNNELLRIENAISLDFIQ